MKTARSLSIVARTLGLLTLVACGVEGGATIPQGQRSQASCGWQDFEATVQEGPNKGLTLRGAVMLSEDPQGRLRGSLRQQDEGAAITVEGSIVGRRDQVTLRFLTDKGVVEGVGPLSKAGQLCQDQLQGTLTGPTESDEGDWLGSVPLTPFCSETKLDDGRVVITCSSGGSTCTTTYFPGGAAQTVCYKSGGRPGL